MAQVLSMGMKSTKFCIARLQGDAPQYLKQFGSTYAWDADIRVALQFTNEDTATAMAVRIAGGAQVAEMVEA